MRIGLLLLFFSWLFLSLNLILTEDLEPREIVIVLSLYEGEVPYGESHLFQQQIEDEPAFPYVEVRDTIHGNVVARIGLHTNEANIIWAPEGIYYIDIWKSENWHILYTGLDDEGIPLDAEHQSFEIRYAPSKYSYADAPRRIEPGLNIPLLLGAHKTGEARVVFRIYDGRTGVKVDEKVVDILQDWHAVYYYSKNQFQLEGGEVYISVESVVSTVSGGWTHEFHNIYVLCSNYYLPKLSSWYAGDCHVHTEFTDNEIEFGIPSDSITIGGRYFGLNFVTCTDHSHDLSSTDWLQLGSYMGNYSGFWLLRGEEVSARAYGNPFPYASHYLSYGISQLIYTGSWSSLYEYCDHQWVINEVNNQGGFGYIAHPFDSNYPWDNYNNNTDTFALKGYTGMEIATYNLSESAKNKWIELLRQGRRLYAIGNSDAHDLCNLGAYGGYRTYVYCPQGLSQSYILDALKNGRSVVTQGPLCTFSINGVPVGGTVTTTRNAVLTLNIQGSVTPEWSNDSRIYFVVHYSTTDGSFSSEAELPVYDFSAWPSGSRTVSFEVSRLLNRDGYIRLEGRSNSPYGERWFYTNPIWVRIPPQFNELPSLFASNSFHVVGNEAYCTDVLGTANFSWIFGQKNMQMPYGRTDTILQSSEHDTSNLLITGGPAVNPLAQEFDEEFGITYTLDTSFTISCENQSISLPLYQYPRKDIGIVYLGRQNGRYILLAWGYGWRGTYAATVIMSHPDLWAFYGGQHFLFIQWEDAYPYDGLVTWNEIRVVYPYNHSLSSPPPGSWYLYQPTFEYMQYLFGGNSIHVAGDTAYCTDVLGTAHVSWIFGRYYLQRPEGRTDLILPSTEHDTANLIITGGPAVNPLAVEMGSIQNFNISYNYQPSLPEPYFEIISDNYSYRLYLRDYPRKDICIIHLGRQGNRNVLVIWGYGWRGTYAGTLIMATPSFWYTNCHMMLLEWNDYNYDGLVQLSEISVKYTAYNPHIVV